MQNHNLQEVWIVQWVMNVDVEKFQECLDGWSHLFSLSMDSGEQILAAILVYPVPFTGWGILAITGFWNKASLGSKESETSLKLSM